MLRFMVGPGRVLVPDLAARLPGRGIWLSARADVLERALKRGAFAHAARGPVSIPADLVSMIATGLARRIVDRLGMARRAGEAVGGFAKAREMIVSARAGLVVQAYDGSTEECRRLLSGAAGMPVVRPLTADRLGAVFGRDHLVHVVVARGTLAKSVAVEAARLAGVMGETDFSDDGASRRPTSERIGE